MSEVAPPIPFEAFDQLATMVALVRADGGCLLANATLENTAGLSRRALQRGNVLGDRSGHIVRQSDLTQYDSEQGAVDACSARAPVAVNCRCT